jgi:hypothetical protein
LRRPLTASRSLGLLGRATLLTMKIEFPSRSGLILRSPPQAGVSKDGQEKIACP